MIVKLFFQSHNFLISNSLNLEKVFGSHKIFFLNLLRLFIIERLYFHLLKRKNIYLMLLFTFRANELKIN